MPARVLRLRPLVWLGTISYGVYLYHWPVFLWATPRRLDAGDALTNGVRMALTVAMAVLSFHLVERPALRRRDHPLRTLAAGGLALAVTTGVATVVVPVPAPVRRSSSPTASNRRPAPWRPVRWRPMRPTSMTSTPTPRRGRRDGRDAGDGGGGDRGDGRGRGGGPSRDRRRAPPRRASPRRCGSRPARSPTRPGSSSWATRWRRPSAAASSGGRPPRASARVYVAGWVGCPITLGGTYRWNDGVEVPIPGSCDWGRARPTSTSSSPTWSSCRAVCGRWPTGGSTRTARGRTSASPP